MFIAETDGWQFFYNALSFILPALVVFGIVYVVINRFFVEQRKVRLLELKKEQMKEITPVKLQAYERLTIFLDRISPENLIIRLSRSGQTAGQLKHELVQSIASEYNHNISQQIYVTNDTWSMIQAVKEQILTTIEVCYQDCDENETGPTFGKKLLSRLMTEENLTQKAIQLLKNEIEIAL